MNKKFSIYDSPLSDETKKIRRNTLISSSICIFIGMTHQLPCSFALWGAKFTSAQQTTIGWLLFSITLYLFLHLIASAGIEIAKWVQPFYEAIITKRSLLRHPAFDETDWMKLFRGDNIHDIEKEAKSEARLHVQRRLRHLYNLIYLKLIIEIILPLVVGATGLVMLISLIISEDKIKCL